MGNNSSKCSSKRDHWTLYKINQLPLWIQAIHNMHSWTKISSISPHCSRIICLLAFRCCKTHRTSKSCQIQMAQIETTVRASSSHQRCREEVVRRALVITNHPRRILCQNRVSSQKVPKAIILTYSISTSSLWVRIQDIQEALSKCQVPIAIL